MRVAIVVLGLIAIVWIWTIHSKHRTEHRLAGVASELAGRPVGVRCQGFFAELVDIGQRTGEVDFPANRPPDHMFLTRGICGQLRHFLGSHSHRDLDCLTTIDWRTWSFQTGWFGTCERHARADAEAITTLAHESMHLRGIQSESEAQCKAVQADAWTTVRLGGTAEQGLAVARYVLALQPGMSPEYQFGRCPLPPVPLIPS